jgi:pimeloyl-ACP methyl ester carboxylesterase
MRRGYLDTPDGQIHYTTAGNRGPLLFLLHTSPLTSAEYARVMMAMANEVRAVAFDNPGYGHSDPPRLASSPTLADYARPLAAAIDSFGVERFALAGTHTGAGIALALASSLLKGRLTHLILSGIPFFTPEEVTYYRARTVRPEAHADGRHLSQAWTRQIERWGPDTDLATHNWGIACGLWAQDSPRNPTVACSDYDMVTALKGLDVPTLVVNGERDPLTKNDRRAVPLIPNATFTVVPGRTGPSLPYAEPGTYAQIVLGFLKRG